MKNIGIFLILSFTLLYLSSSVQTPIKEDKTVSVLMENFNSTIYFIDAIIRDKRGISVEQVRLCMSPYFYSSWMRTDDCEKSWNYANCHYRGGLLFDYSRTPGYESDDTYSNYNNLLGYSASNNITFRDHTKMASINFNFMFLSVDNDYIYNFPVTGCFGLSLIKNQSAYKLPSLIEQFYSLKYISKKIMGVYIDSNSNNSLSEIIFGGYNDKHISSNPFITIFHDQSDFKAFRFSFTSIVVGTAVTSSGQASIDFNGEITMRESIFAPIKDYFINNLKYKCTLTANTYKSFSCIVPSKKELEKAFPLFTVKVGGNSLSLLPNHYVYYKNGVADFRIVISNNITEGIDVVLGPNFLMGFYTIFDYDEFSIKFSPYYPPPSPIGNTMIIGWILIISGIVLIGLFTYLCLKPPKPAFKFKYLPIPRNA